MIKNVTGLKKKNNKKGFTLIELVVVIAILAILAALAIPRLTGAQDRAKISADKATFATLNSAVAIAIAEDRVTADYKITIAGTGVITAPSNLLESGAAFKVAANQGLGSLTWKISGGTITAAPTINEATGVIADSN